MLWDVEAQMFFTSEKWVPQEAVAGGPVHPQHKTELSPPRGGQGARPASGEPCVPESSPPKARLGSR